MTNPRQYKIPDWFLNRQKDIVDGKYVQVCNFKRNISKLKFFFKKINLNCDK